MSRTSPRQPPLGDPILVVDDDPELRSLLGVYLDDLDHTVVDCGDGATALEICKRTQLGAVLLDLRLPDIEGLDVLRWIRQRWTRETLPVIVVSARTGDDTVRLALELGANDYVTKPVQPYALVRRMESVIQTCRRAAELDESMTTSVILDLPESPASTYDHYCPSCGSVAPATRPVCYECGHRRGDGQWPKIADSEYPLLGSTVGRFVLDRYLRRGAMSVVYRAIDPTLRRHLAVKILNLDTHRDPITPRALIARARLEALAAAKVRSPHVVKIWDLIVMDDNSAAIVMELVEGEVLGDRLERRGKLEVREALEVARQLALGLFEAHLQSLVHRDIKPENVVIERLPTGEAFARILDFGLVYVLGRRSNRKAFGTPAYAAPEQLQGSEQVDPRADIYAVGAVLFAMISGNAPFPHKKLIDVLAAKLNSGVPALNAEDVPDDGVRARLNEVIAKASAIDVEDRYPSMREFVDAIDRIAAVVGR